MPVAVLFERPLREREVVGSIPGRVISKMFKMVPMSTLLGAPTSPHPANMKTRNYEMMGSSNKKKIPRS